MLPSMPETPLVPSWFAYGLFKRLRKDLPANEYEEFVRWWNSRLSRKFLPGRTDGSESSGRRLLLVTSNQLLHEP